jgi:hypothetical protein
MLNFVPSSASSAVFEVTVQAQTAIQEIQIWVCNQRLRVIRRGRFRNRCSATRLA